MADTFPAVIAFAFMVSMLLVGTVLRAKVRWLQRGLVPASLIGGVVGFLLVALGLSFGLTHADFTVFAFHFFTLSFMSLVLTGSREEHRGSTIALGGMWLSVVWVMSLVMQALIGLGVIGAYNAIADQSLSEFLGMIATHGFTQGPGQALALGSIWESEYGIEHAVSFGLIYASVGFLVAFAAGVPIARYAVRSGLNVNREAHIGAEMLRGLMDTGSARSTGSHVTHPANVDTLAYHISILGAAYLLTDQYLKLVQPMAAELVVTGINFGVVFSYNFFFVHGLLVCVVLRAVLNRSGLGRFIDNDTQTRITGSSVDLMVVATIMSIEFSLLWAFITPIVLVCTFVTLLTAALCFGFGRLLGRYRWERSLAAFGCCTGSTGSGILLLRILDPDLTTPVPKELAFFNIAILFLSFHVLLLMAPVLPAISMGTVLGVYAGTFVLGIAALLVLKRLEDPRQPVPPPHSP